MDYYPRERRSNRDQPRNPPPLAEPFPQRLNLRATAEWSKLTLSRRRPTAAFGYPSWPAVTKLLSRKLQLPLNCLEARLLAQGIHQRVGFRVLQPRIAQAPGCLEPVERLRPIAPVRNGRRVLVRRGISQCCLRFRNLGFRTRLATKLVVDHRKVLLARPEVRFRLASGARVLKIPERVVDKLAKPWLLPNNIWAEQYPAFDSTFWRPGGPPWRNVQTAEGRAPRQPSTLQAPGPAADR